MAKFLWAKAKRKDLEVVHKEFSEFLLVPQSKKIKTLEEISKGEQISLLRIRTSKERITNDTSYHQDAELPLGMKEEETMVPLEFEQQLPIGCMYASMQQMGAMMAKNMPDFQANGNSKFCFHKPLNAPVVLSTNSTDVSFKAHSDLISDTKSQYVLPTDPNLMMMEEVPVNNKPVEVNSHFDVVVPLVQSQAFATIHEMEDIRSESNLSEPMEAEEERDALLELEEDREQQNHMTAQLYTSNPVLWSGFF